jgi:hypothetical protein
MSSIYKTDNKLFIFSLFFYLKLYDWFQYTLLKTLYNFANWLFMLQFTITNDSHCDTSNDYFWFVIIFTVNYWSLNICISKPFYSKNTRTHNFSFSMFNWSKILLQACKGQQIVNLLLCTIVDRTFVIHAYLLLAFI